MAHINPWEEQQIISDIIRGIEGALYDTEHETNGLSEIQLNKLIYLAVDRWDLPVLYSWFRYGPAIASEDGAASGISPSAIQDLPEPDQPSVGKVRGYPSPHEYKLFFEEQDDWHQIIELESQNSKSRFIGLDLLDYLSEFYKENAPPEYRELYLANIEIQKIFRRIVSDEDIVSNCQEYYDEMINRSVVLHTKLITNESFDTVIENRVIKFTDLVEDVLMMILQMSDDRSLRSDQEAVIHNLEDFYHRQAWKYPALVISKETATGSNKYKLRSGCENDLQEFNDSYPAAIKQLEDDCIDADLFPSLDDYPTTDNTTISDDIGELEEYYLHTT